jgi:trehalose 6-phosphate synthase/phosphatase
MSSARPKLIVVSNRLPLSFKMDGDTVSAAPSSGGLVSALAPILAEYGGTWIGSIGAPSTSRKQEALVRRVLTKTARKQSYQYWPIFLSEEEQINFYEGFSNEVVWPLFHDLQSRCNFLPQYWEFYRRVNGRYADAIHKASRAEDTIWIQDYQLMDVARQLRGERAKGKLAFFMHIPFPAPDIFEKLPWRKQILEGLLQHDLLGLQTQRDERNLISCLRAFVPDVQIVGSRDGRSVTHKGRTSHVQFFPISIDYQQFSSSAASSAVEQRSAEIRVHLKNVHITLGVDRLDYTKGIPERLRAFSTLLREYPKLRGKVSLYQVVVPSRETIAGYQQLKGEVERQITAINGEYSVPGWTPVHYVHRALPNEELLGLYRAADSALVTPLKDGMNLVAKEYCAAQIHNEGVLILSEFAGAAPELRTGALLVNPYDELGVAAALNRAFSMLRPERQKRMRRLRTQIRKHDILHWRDSFFDSLSRAI